MCGIVGYTGTKNSVDIILEGLSRLEYRGYDSAGICLKTDSNELKQVKKTGKLQNLKDELAKTDPSSVIGIGHTRWATHGGVTDFNAHPHGNDLVNIVHNGIIENASELKKVLQSEGWEFHSQTDTEVFLVLVTKFLKETKDLRSSVAKAFQQITGNSAFVVMEKETNRIFAVKRAAPLVVGKKSEEVGLYASSDPYALIGYVDEIFFPEDEVIIQLDPSAENEIQFFELDGNLSNRYMTKEQDMNMEVSDKGNYDHFMLKEIYEQPELIRAFSNYYLFGDGKQKLEELRNLNPRLFHISACGTAWHAGLCIANYMEAKNRIPCKVELASEFRYRNPLIQEGDIGMFISQSGETADTLAAQELCKEKGLKTIGIINTEGSTIYRNCDYNLLIKAGAEIGVASTKAFTLQVLTGGLLTAMMGKDEISIYKDEIEVLAARIEELLANAKQFQDIAEKVHNYKGFIFTGRGLYYPIALEGALKLKEIAYVHAEGYASGELKHGPIALIDENMVNICIVGPQLYEKTRSNLEEVKARNGLIVTFGPEGDKSLEELSDFYVPLKFNDFQYLAPLYVNVAAQLLAYYIARFKGTDIDKPRNLAKSVTVE